MIKKETFEEQVLEYHQNPSGKLRVEPSKPYDSQYYLSLAYTPGVALPCLKIAEQPEDAYRYTTKGNLVAVISNGTAVLGLGNIGALASKPVMEGKAMLFKVLAGIDAFDIEIDTADVDRFVDTVKAIAPTFGGINLEDIKAPECFEIERRLKDELQIPVMHDDQHGTAIITSAALLNALDLAGKQIKDIRVVVNGAGAAASACADLYLDLGVKKEHLIMCDSKGVIYASREGLTAEKSRFATESSVRTLSEALVGADMFLGVSKADVLTPDMIRSMAPNPIVFALANPNPEIAYEAAIESRPDIILATGRSDYPNQVNNVAGFPYIFRGALDVWASTINKEMKLAAVYEIAALAKEPITEEIRQAYHVDNLVFSREYIIPKPLDSRLMTRVSIAVARAAVKSGVARKPIKDWDDYANHLNTLRKK